MRWERIVSTMSCGKLVIEDGRAVDTFGGPPRKNDLILAFVRYKRRLTNGWGTTDVLTQYNGQMEWQEGHINAPANEAVGVFTTNISGGSTSRWSA